MVAAVWGAWSGFPGTTRPASFCAPSRRERARLTSRGCAVGLRRFACARFSFVLFERAPLAAWVYDGGVPRVDGLLHGL